MDQPSSKPNREHGKRKASSEQEFTSAKRSDPQSSQQFVDKPSISAPEIDLYTDLNLSDLCTFESLDEPESFEGNGVKNSSSGDMASDSPAELSGTENGNPTSTLSREECPFVASDGQDSQSGGADPPSGVPPSLILENEPTITVNGIIMDTGNVYHDTMYSSEDELSNSDDTNQVRDGAESRSQDSDFDNDDIDALLEESDGYGLKTDQEKAEKAPLIISLEKHVLVEKGQHHFEFLPNGWLKVTHQSGVPVYFHRETRICTLGRPYGLGRAGLRGHKIPVSAIPCLEYRRALDEEAALSSAAVNGSSCPQASTSSDSHSAKVYTADDHVQKSLLTAVAVRDYCSGLFEFKTKTIHRYSNWKVGRGQLRIAKKVQAGKKEEAEAEAAAAASSANLEDGECDAPATMVKGAQMITIIRPGPDGKSTVTFNMNPANKTPVSIFAEFVQHSRRDHPTYTWLELPDSNTPFQCMALVNGREEGQGVGASKKLAKLEAARNALMKLAPELKAVLELQARNMDGSKDDNIFDDILIDDHRVGEIAHKSSHPGPYQLLVNALQRQDLHPTKPTPKMNHLPHLKTHLKNTYTMTAGDYKATYTHQIKKFAQQMCAQLILKQMHPELKYYGDLLRLYGRKVDREKVKRKEDQRSITDLQTKGKWGEPNWELLEKLKAVMQTVIPVPLKPGETSRIRY